MGDAALSQTRSERELVRWLRERIAQLLLVDPARIDEDASFFGLGLDSCQLTQLAEQLEERLGRRVAASLPFDCPSISSLCNHLAGVPGDRRPDGPAGGAVHAGVAVIGVACRLPGGIDTPESLWRALMEGRDLVGTMPEVRALLERLPADRRPVGSFLSAIDRFDADFFGVSHREAPFLDPQHRILLEVTCEALERAGIRLGPLRGGAVGVFMGVGAPEYARRHLWSGDESRIGPYSATGSAPSAAVGRISFCLGLRGPCAAIDTACSSSASAIHLACASLASGESRLALAGGVNAILSWEAGRAMERLGAISPSGRCRSFDRSADGYVRGEGCAVFVLKRLEDAASDGDFVWAVIEGSAMNQDGLSAGLTAPNGEAQAQLIRSALSRAGVSPKDISLIETHGTGTQLGDAIELRALHEVFGAHKPLIGAIKANLGHLEAAAGAVGALKAVLCLRNRCAVPQIHVTSPHAEIADERGALRLPDCALPLPHDARVGVSSFGFSGTNVHLVLRASAPEPAQSAVGATPELTPRPWLIPLSGRDRGAPARQAQRIADWLADADLPDAAALEATQAHLRDHYAYRAAAFGRDIPGLIASLRATPARVERAESRCAIAFVYSGQGGQWAGMGRGLACEDAAFREGWEEALAAVTEFAPALGVASPALVDDERSLEDIDRVQPLIFAHQVALTQMWRSAGVQPAFVIGHSMGEVAAAWCAGHLALRDAARVVCARSQVLASTARSGAMAFVACPFADLAEHLAAIPERIELAASNAPRACVVTGSRSGIESLLARLERAGIQARCIRVNAAAHSRDVESGLSALRDALLDLEPQRGDRAMLSTVDLAWCQGRSLDADYWALNLRQPVRFAEAVCELARAGAHAFVELGPHPVLLGSVSDCLIAAESEAIAVASSLRDADEGMERARGLGELFARGVELNWSRLAPRSTRSVPLTYPWSHRSHWLTPGTEAVDVAPIAAEPEETHPDADFRVPIRTRAELLELVTREVAAVLQRDPEEIDPQAPLQELGMDSLLALRFTRALGCQLGARLPSTTVWEHATIRALVGALDAGGNARAAAAIRDPEDEPPTRELSYAQQLDLIESVLGERDT